jgi:hypothetical protein
MAYHNLREKNQASLGKGGERNWGDGDRCKATASNSPSGLRTILLIYPSSKSY